VEAANLTGTLAIANGGTGQTTQQAAINALAGATTSAQFLRGNGTNVVMSAIQVSDVPTLNQNTSGTAAGLSATLAVSSGGTGQTTQQAAINALAGATTSAQFLRGNGTNVVMSAIQVADVPTLNQNTTGQAGSVANSVTFNTSGGAAAGSTFNGSAARTVDYSTVGAPSTTGTNASGTWGISISGNAATATSATSATSASSASTATALTTATGSAPSYSARAWVNFDGFTGSYRTVGNVSSVTRTGTGKYTIAFTTALPDANYTFAGGAGNNTTQNLSVCIPYNLSVPTASGCDVETNQQNAGLIDGSLVTITFFR
jgi:hypothetical protein